MYTQTKIADGEISPELELLQLVTGYWFSQAVWTVAKLGIADLLKDGPQSTSYLSTQTGTHEPSLYRLMRALASRGLLTELDERRFALAPIGAYLRSDLSGSLRDAAVMLAEPWFWSAWGNLLHAVKVGGPAFNSVFGKPFFQYLTENTEAGALFDAGMTVLSAPVVDAVASAVDLSLYHRIVDVGGGEGTLVCELLKRNPHLQGVVFDLPEAIHHALTKTPDADGIKERIEFVGGSFFDSVPGGADLYILKSVLHNWGDRESAKVLENCRRAINPGGDLFIIERVLPARIDQSLAAQAMAMADLHMLVTLTGRERTQEEFRELLGSCRFTLERIIDTKSAFSILKAS